MPTFPRLKYISLLLGLIPFVFFSWSLFTFSINIPWLDDFEAPMTIRAWFAQPDWLDRLKMIWFPNNEHRIVTLRLWVMVHYLVFNQLDLKALLLTSHIYILIIFVLFWFNLPVKNRWWYFLPIPFLYLNFQYHLNTFWFIVSIQRNLVIGFGFLAMFCLSKGSHKLFITGVVCTMLACLSNSDGLLFIAAGGMILLTKFEVKKLGIWIGIFVTFLFLFFWNYPSMGSNQNGLIYLAGHPWQSIQGFFVFLGGSADYFNEQDSTIRLIFSFSMGLLLFIIIIWGFQRWIFTNTEKKYSSFSQRWTSGELANSHQLFLAGCLTFCILNGVLLALLRSKSGPFVFLIGNYKIIATLAMLLTYVVSTHLVSSVFTTKWVLPVAIVFWISSIVTYYPAIKNRKEFLLQDYQSFIHDKQGLGFNKENVKKYELHLMMVQMIHKGEYIPGTK